MRYLFLVFSLNFLGCTYPELETESIYPNDSLIVTTGFTPNQMVNYRDPFYLCNLSCDTIEVPIYIVIKNSPVSTDFDAGTFFIRMNSLTFCRDSLRGDTSIWNCQPPYTYDSLDIKYFTLAPKQKLKINNPRARGIFDSLTFDVKYFRYVKGTKKTVIDTFYLVYNYKIDKYQYSKKFKVDCAAADKLLTPIGKGGIQ